MRRVLTTSFLIFALSFLALSAIAQQPEFDGEPGPKGDHPRWGKMSANMENLRMLKLLEALDLNEEQSQKFVPLVHGFRKDVRAFRDQRDTLIAGIREMLGSGADDNTILAEIDKLKENQARLDARQDKFQTDCKAFLTVPQLARLVIFQERFEREMLESLREYRRHGDMPGMNRKPGKI